MKTKLYLLSLLIIGISLANLNAQRWVGNFKETGLWTGGGFAYNETYTGIWIGEINTTRIAAIELDHKEKEFTIYDSLVKGMTVVGKKGVIHGVIAYSYSDPDGLNFLYESLIGAGSVIKLGGNYGTALFPKTAKGNRFMGFYDPDDVSNNSFYQGTRTLTLDSKKTETYNRNMLSVEIATDLITDFYKKLGYTNATPP